MERIMKYYQINTEQGTIFTYRWYKKENNDYVPDSPMYEVFTGLICEYYYEYIQFIDKNKYLKFGSFSRKKDLAIIDSDNVIEFNSLEFSKRLQILLSLNIDMKASVLNIIDKGISLKDIEYIRLKDYFEKFNKIFGDLFEEEAKRLKVRI